MEPGWEPGFVRGGRGGLCGSGVVGSTHPGAIAPPPRKLEGPTFLARWASDGTRIVTAGNAGVRLWDAHTLEPVSPPLSLTGTVDCAFSPRGDVLATAMNIPYVQLWNAQTGRALVPRLNLPDVAVRLRFSSDGSRLAVAGIDGSIEVWSIPEGKLVLGPLHHGGVCWIAAFSPDARSLVSASSDMTVRLWDTATGRPLQAPLQHDSAVLWAEFSPNGQFIATSTELGLVRVWDASTGQLRGQIMRHPGKVWLVKWSPDGRLLATTCTDGFARVWDSRTGHLVAEPFPHQAEVRRAEFSPDGHRLLTASVDGTAKIWDLSLLRAPVPAPDWLPGLAESLAGIRIGAQDAPETVASDSFQQVRERIAHAFKPDEFYSRWVAWMLEARLQRPVKPFQP